MKWRVLVGLCVTMTACARDASAPDVMLRDDAGDGGPDTEEPVPSPAGDDAGEGPGPTPSPTPTPKPDAGSPSSPEGDAGSELPRCDGPQPEDSVEVPGATFSGVSVGGRGNRVSARPGDRLSVAFAYEPTTCDLSPVPTISPRIGLAEGATVCAAMGTLCVPPIIPGTSGPTNTVLSLTAPSAPGEYGIYAALEHGTTFSGGMCAPFTDTPAESTRIATLCVQ